jgi:DNA replication protein DnaC
MRQGSSIYERTCIKNQEKVNDERTKQGYRSVECKNQDKQKTMKKEQEKEISEEKKQEILNHVKYKSGINPMFVSTSTNK